MNADYWYCQCSARGTDGRDGLSAHTETHTDGKWRKVILTTDPFTSEEALVRILGTPE
jgi:hypothetical protein